MPKETVSARRLSMDLRISDKSLRRIIKSYLVLHPYKQAQSNYYFSMTKKSNGKKFTNWIRTNFSKKKTP